MLAAFQVGRQFELKVTANAYCFESLLATCSYYLLSLVHMRTKGYSSHQVCLLFCRLVCFGAQSAFIALQLVHG